MSTGNERLAPTLYGELAVVIPAYNAGRTIARAIESSIECGAKEIIVVDDGSTDNTSEVAKSKGCLVIAQENRGAAAARRIGVASVNCEFVALLDSDDRLIPTGVMRSIQALRGNESAAVSIGRTIGVAADNFRTNYRNWTDPITTARLLRVGFSPAPPASMIWRLDHLREAMFGITPAIWPRYAEDYELLIRTSMLGEILQHDEPAAIYALTGGKSALTPLASAADAERIRNHYANLIGIQVRRLSKRQLQSRAELRMAKESVSASSSWRRQAAILRALYFDPPFMVRVITASLWHRLGVRNG